MTDYKKELLKLIEESEAENENYQELLYICFHYLLEHGKKV